MAFGIEQVAGFAADMQCISSMWFRKIQGGTHKERLESFYGPQAHACETLTTCLPPDLVPLLMLCLLQSACVPPLAQI